MSSRNIPLPPRPIRTSQSIRVHRSNSIDTNAIRKHANPTRPLPALPYSARDNIIHRYNSFEGLLKNLESQKEEEPNLSDYTYKNLVEPPNIVSESSPRRFGSSYLNSRKLKNFQERETDRKETISITNNLCNNLSRIENPEITEKNMKTCREILNILFQSYEDCINSVKPKIEPTALVLSELKEEFKRVTNNLISIIESRENLPTIEKITEEFEKQRDFLVARNTEQKKYISVVESQVSEKDQQITELEKKLFQMKSDVEQADLKVQDMVEIARQQRSTIAQKDAQITAYSRQGTDPLPTIGDVPKDVLKIWNDVSFFVHLFENNVLSEIDMTPLFPANPIEHKPEQCLFHLPKPNERDTSQYLHFTVFFKEMKNEFPIDFYKGLEKKLYAFFMSVSNAYTKNFQNFMDLEHKIIEDTENKIASIREKPPDENKWVNMMIENKVKVKIPKNSNPISISETISKVAELFDQTIHTDKAMYYVTDYLVNVLRDHEPILIIALLSDIGKQSTNNAEINLFKNFLLRAIPFHAFILYAHIIKNRSTFSREAEKRNFLKKYFECFGLNCAQAKTENDKSVEQFLLKSDISFIIGCIAMYLDVIESIKKMYSNNESAKDLARKLVGRNKVEEEHKTIDFMSFLSYGQPNIESYGVVCFWKRKGVLRVLQNFVPQENSFCSQYMKQLNSKK